MTDDRTAYHLTRSQVLAVCEALNKTGQERTELLSRPHMQLPQCADSRLIITNRLKADAALVSALLAGLRIEGGNAWPLDRHHAFASQSEIDSVPVTQAPAQVATTGGHT